MDNQTQVQLKQAKLLIQEKRYSEAMDILITVDHPIADKWYQRLKDLPQAQAETTQAKKQADSKKTLMGCLWVVLALVICAVVITIATDRPQYERNIEVACNQARGQGFWCNQEVILDSYLNQLKKCENSVGGSSPAYDVYLFCLQNEGVPIREVE